VILEALLEVDEVRRVAGDKDLGAGRIGKVADVADGVAAPIRVEGAVLHHLDHGVVVAELARRVDLDDTVDALDLVLDHGQRRRRGVLDHQPHRAVPVGRELGLQHVVDLPGAVPFSEDRSVHRGELEVEGGDPEHDQERRAQDRDRNRAAHDQVREPIPEPALLGPGVAICAALEEGRRQGVDPVAKQRQDSRQHRQCDRRR
jgi:hypothetical protein